MFIQIPAIALYVKRVHQQLTMETQVISKPDGANLPSGPVKIVGGSLRHLVHRGALFES